MGEPTKAHPFLVSTSISFPFFNRTGRIISVYGDLTYGVLRNERRGIYIYFKLLYIVIYNNYI